MRELYKKIVAFTGAYFKKPLIIHLEYSVFNSLANDLAENKTKVEMITDIVNDPAFSEPYKVSFIKHILSLTIDNEAQEVNTK